MTEEKPSALAIAALATGICSLLPLLGTGPGIDLELWFKFEKK